MATFGYTTIGASTAASNADAMQMFRWLLGEEATLTSMSFYTSIASGTGTFKCALYRASDRALIAQTDEGTTTTSAGWVTVNFTSALTIPADTYWLVAFWDFVAQNISYYYDNTTTEGAFVTTGYGAFPDPMPAFGGTGTRQLSLYVTYTPVAGERPGNLSRRVDVGNGMSSNDSAT